MSVINQMLKDLDQRKTSNQHGVDMFRLLRVGPGFSNRSHTVNLGFILLIPSLLLVLLIAKNWNFSKSEHVDFSASQDRQNVLPIVSSYELPHQTEPVIVYDNELVKDDGEINVMGIESISIKDSNNVFSVEIESLNSLSSSVVRMDLENNIIQYRIENVKLETETPSVSFDNRYVDSLNIDAHDDAVIIRIAPKENMISNFTESMPVDYKGYRLSINIKPNMVKTKSASEHVIFERQAVADMETTESIATNTEERIVSIKKKPRHKVNEKSKYNNALNLLKSGRVEKAIIQLEQVLRYSPGLTEARITLSSVYLKSGRFMEAAIVLNDGNVQDPYNADIALMYGRVLVERGELERSSYILKAAEQNAQNNAEYLALIAAVSQRLKKHEEAVDYYLRALDLVSSKSIWWVGMGISLEALEKNEEARKAYQAAKSSGLSEAELMKYVDARIKHLSA